MKRGDIVLVASGEPGKPRPVVVVQADELGEGTMTVLACPITPEIAERLPLRPVAEATENNGLRVRSQVMTDRILAVPRDRVRQVVGVLDPVSVNRLDAAMLLVLGLINPAAGVPQAAANCNGSDPLDRCGFSLTRAAKGQMDLPWTIRTTPAVSVRVAFRRGRGIC